MLFGTLNGHKDDCAVFVRLVSLSVRLVIVSDSPSLVCGLMLSLLLCLEVAGSNPGVVYAKPNPIKALHKA